MFIEIGRERGESGYRVRSTRLSLGRAERESTIMEYTQEPLFYTAEDMVAKVTEALNASYQDADLRVQRAKDNLNASIAERLVSLLKDRVSEGDFDKTTAQDMYDVMKLHFNWADANLTANQYNVTVTLDGSLIAEIEVEAEDEDEACDIVRDDFTLYNADVSLTFVDGHGNEYDHQVTGVEHELSDYQDNLDFVAEEQ